MITATITLAASTERVCINFESANLLKPGSSQGPKSSGTRRAIRKKRAGSVQAESSLAVGAGAPSQDVVPTVGDLAQLVDRFVEVAAFGREVPFSA